MNQDRGHRIKMRSVSSDPTAWSDPHLPANPQQQNTEISGLSQKYGFDKKIPESLARNLGVDLYLS